MKRRVLAYFSAVMGLLGTLTAVSFAQSPAPSDFGLDVTPSPIVQTIKPGVTSTFDLKIRNRASSTVQLKMDVRKFSVDAKTGTIQLSQEAPEDIAKWVSFAAPTFSVQSGQWYTQQVKIALPKDSGFSYSFAITISPNTTDTPTGPGRLIKGTVADFTLINVDRPGAMRKVEISELSTDQQVYEFLPAKINVRFKNTGNTIAQPAGNVFIQRGATDKEPLATLKVNQSGGYILPGSERLVSTSWTDGSPRYKANSDGTTSGDVDVDWSDLSKFRIGQYTAKVIAVYNDGARDVAIEKTVTFWVIPYKLISIVIIILIALFVLRHKLVQRRTSKAVKKALDTRDSKSS